MDLEFKKEPKEDFRHFVNIKIIGGIRKNFEENIGDLVFKIKLFNPELNDDVFTALKHENLYRGNVKGVSLGLFHLELKREENLEDSDLIVKLIHIKNFIEEGNNFFSHLDDVNRFLFNALFLDLSSFEIKFKPEDIDKFKTYFEEKFQNEYENEYFDFIISNDWSDNRVKIQIIKK